MEFGEKDNEKFLQFIPSSREIHAVYAVTLGTEDTRVKPGGDAKLLREPVVGWIVTSSIIAIEGKTNNFADAEPVTWNKEEREVERIACGSNFLGLEFDGKKEEWRDETKALRELKERVKKRQEQKAEKAKPSGTKKPGDFE